jgi:polysaccharide pyruvyl transferase WcaK-like protein
MHYFPVGNDDRLFARRVAATINDARLTVPMAPLSPTELLKCMASSMFCVAMRFHSVVFSQTIAAPFIAIDYTSGGKIAGFLRDVGEEKRCFDFEKLSGLSLETIKNLVSQRPASTGDLA